MEARGVLREVRLVSVVCRHCHFESKHELGSRVPVAQCPNCGKPVGLMPTGYPQVVSR